MPVEEVQQCLTLGGFHSFDYAGRTRIDEQAFAAGFWMRAHHRVLRRHRLERKGFLLISCNLLITKKQHLVFNECGPHLVEGSIAKFS